MGAAPSPCPPAGGIDISERASRLALRDLRSPAVLVATGFGAGLLPGMPGTWGALLGVALWWLAFAGSHPAVQFGAAAGLWLFGVALVRRLCAVRALDDDPAIVLDEMAGAWIALLFAPANLWAIAVGFALFRLFDVWKPWPVSWADRRVKGGMGVMLDDAIAGVLALALLQGGVVAFEAVATR